MTTTHKDIKDDERQQQHHSRADAWDICIPSSKQMKNNTLTSIKTLQKQC